MEDNHGLSWPIGGPASPDPVMGFDSMNTQGGNQGGRPHTQRWVDEKGIVHEPDKPQKKAAPVVSAPSNPQSTIPDAAAAVTADPMAGKYSGSNAEVIPWYKRPGANKTPEEIQRLDSMAANPVKVKSSPMDPMHQEDTP